MTGWGKGPAVEPRARRKGQGGHWQVLIDGHWIGEQIAQIHEAMARTGDADIVAASFNVDRDRVRKSLARWDEVMAEPVVKDAPPMPVVVDVSSEGPRSTWTPVTNGHQVNGVDRHEYEHVLGMESSSTPPPATPDAEAPAPTAAEPNDDPAPEAPDTPRDGPAHEQVPAEPTPLPPGLVTGRPDIAADLLLDGLWASLPMPGSSWPLGEREDWARLAQAIFRVLYR